MKSVFGVAALAAFVSGHSWLECTNHDNTEILEWSKGNASLSPPKVVDSSQPNLLQYCHGWPRNKPNPGNWIDLSQTYTWNLGANAWNGGKSQGADTHACPAEQRSPTYQANAPMATAQPGGLIRLRFAGNGHSRGFNVGGDPGTVSVYWKGAPEQEITDTSEFTTQNQLATGGFAGDAFVIPADPNVKTPAEGLSDFGNWLPVQLPANMQAGRHMMVWVWSYKDTVQWSTCFDVMIQGSAVAPQPDPNPASNTGGGAPAQGPSAPAAPESPAAPATPASPAGPAAPESPGPTAPESPEPAPPTAPAVPAAPAAPALPEAPSSPAPPPAPAPAPAPAACGVQKIVIERVVIVRELEPASAPERKRMVRRVAARGHPRQFA